MSTPTSAAEFLELAGKSPGHADQVASEEREFHLGPYKILRRVGQGVWGGCTRRNTRP